jgi:hypothetical protein
LIKARRCTELPVGQRVLPHFVAKLLAFGIEGGSFLFTGKLEAAAFDNLAGVR